MRSIALRAFIIFFLACPTLLPAQTVNAKRTDFYPNEKEIGRPYLKNYSSKEYNASVQNWAIAQDRRGVMYFANNLGVLEFDGISWRLLPVTNGSIVRSLATDENGTIYVGAQGELGYLAADSLGRLQYVSLCDSIPTAYRDFADIAKIHATPAGTYFQALDRLFLWAKGRMKVWKPETPFHLSFEVRGRFYIRRPGIGLMQMTDDSLQLLPGGEKFSELRIYVMLPYNDDKILIGTREAGLFIYDGISAVSFPIEVDAFLLENQLYHGAALRNGSFALATLRGGVVIIDKEGRLQQILDESMGLLNNNVWYVASDHQDGLWLALNNGLARAESPPAPISFFNESSGLHGIIESIVRHRERLYVATHQGVFYLQPAYANIREATLRPPVFKPVEGIAAQCWALLSTGAQLLVATSEGVYQIEHERAVLLRASSVHSYALYQSRRDSARVYIGLENGLASLYYLANKKQWRDEGIINGIDTEIRDIHESETGELWLGTRTQGFVRVRFSDGLSHDPPVEVWDTSHGLPPDHGWGTFARVGNRILFVTDKGLFRIDEKSNGFVPDSTFGAAYANGTRSTGEAAVDRHENFWMQSTVGARQEIGVALHQANGTYEWQYAPFARLSDFKVWDIYLEDQAVTEALPLAWFGGPDGLMRYEATTRKNYAVSFSALVRRVGTIDNDSTIFSGAAFHGEAAIEMPVLPFADNALRFEFAATSYDGESTNQFQYFLEGFDQRWSTWTKEERKDYTNISEGTYRFYVRAKNLYEHMGTEATYAFKVLPPWYRSWWAYLFYLGALALFVYGGIKQRTRQLEQRSRKLEETVQERTAELAKQKNNIELLSQIGKDITASLDFDTIFYKLYESVNQLADATIFGVGIYHAEKHQIEYRLAIEKGKRFAPYSRDTLDKNQFPVWCIENRKAVFINDVKSEYAQYITSYEEPKLVLEDGTLSAMPTSLIYLPLFAQERVLGVFTLQSYRRNAYTTDHLKILQSLATYTAIALDNANAYRQLNATLEHLKATQQQLVVQEKLASLGALTAGIAHEIKNPLNFVNNFAVLSIDLAEELRELLQDDADKKIAEVAEEVGDLLQMLKQNAAKINEHGKRADSIVKSMMEHSRGGVGEREVANINALLEEALNLTYHGLRAQNAAFNVAIEKDYDATIGKLEVVPQDLSRVFLNIINNACYAAFEKTKAQDQNSGFVPMLSLATKNLGGKIEVRIRDNGTGIPKEIREQIFNPFFTTKPTGQGTGLGLSISFDIIVQQHKGELKVESEEGEFTEFIITLPA